MFLFIKDTVINIERIESIQLVNITNPDDLTVSGIEGIYNPFGEQSSHRDIGSEVMMIGSSEAIFLPLTPLEIITKINEIRNN